MLIKLSYELTMILTMIYVTKYVIPNNQAYERSIIKYVFSLGMT